jgi:sugar lactone lactonase YvrE
MYSDAWRRYNANFYRAGQASFVNAVLANDNPIGGACFDPNGNVWMIRYGATGGTDLYSLEKFERRMRFDNHKPTKGILLPSVVSAAQQPGSQTVAITYRVDMTSVGSGTLASTGSVTASGTVTTAIVGWLGGVKNWAHLVAPSVGTGTYSATGTYFWSDMYDPTTLIDSRYVLQDTINANAVDSAGNVYVATDRCIRKISPSGNVTTLAGLAGSASYVDDVGATARFYNPKGICVDASGNVYVVEWDGHVVRKITPNGVVTTIAGYYGSGGDTNGVGSAARFYYPSQITVAPNGTLYVAEYHGQRVRKLEPDATGTVYTVSTLASSQGYLDGIAVDSKGNIFASGTNGRILKLNAAGAVTVFAGTADQSGYVDGSGTAARFQNPHGISIDSSDNIYLAENNNRLRKITPAAEVTTVGQTIGTVINVAVDSVGSLYVAETSTTNGFGRIVRKGALAPASQGGIVSTQGVLGAGVQTGTLRTVSWDVSKDLPGMNFANLSFEILAKDSRPEIGAHFVTIPADSTAGAGGTDLKISNRPVDESDLSDLWVWLLAQRDPRIKIEGNTIVLTPAGLTFIANAPDISDASADEKASLVLHTGGTGGLDNNWSNWGATTKRGRAFAYKLANYRPVTAAEITRATAGRFNLNSVDHYSAVNLGQ